MTQLSVSYEAAVALFRKAEAELLVGGNDASMWREVADGLRNACQIIPQWSPHGGCMRLAGEGWMVSFKAEPSDSDLPETALINRRTNTFHMLIGDHRLAYEAAAAGGWDALFAVFTSLEPQYFHESTDRG